MQKRLIRWFFFNLLFALTPLSAVLVIRSLVGQLSLQNMQENLSEILFFSLMISVTALDDLDDIISAFSKDPVLYALRLFLIFGATWSAILYGVFLVDVIVGTNIAVLRSRLMYVSIGIAIVLFVVSTAAEIFLAKVVDLDKK